MLLLTNITTCFRTVGDNLNQPNDYHQNHNHSEVHLKHHHHQHHLLQPLVKRLLTKLVIERTAEKTAFLVVQSLLARRITVLGLREHFHDQLFEEKKFKKRISDKLAKRTVKKSAELSATIDAFLLANSISYLYEQILYLNGLKEDYQFRWFRRHFVKCFTKQWLVHFY